MACRLDGAKPLSEPMLEYFNWTLWNKFQWNFNRNSNIFIHENEFESVVCEMAAILSRPQCVKQHIITWISGDPVHPTIICVIRPQWVNTLRPRQTGRHFADDIFKCILLNENAWISLKISLKFVPGVRINNIPALVQIMAWRRTGDKPLSEPMMDNLLTHICVTRPQWVNLGWA